MIAKEIQRLAAALGMDNPSRLNTAEMIRYIQFQEGDMPCFSQSWSAPCRIADCPMCRKCTSCSDYGRVGNA